MFQPRRPTGTQSAYALVVLPFQSHPAVFACLATALCACQHDAAPQTRPAAAAKVGVNAVHSPPKLTSIETGKSDGLGRPIRVACVTCHGTRDAGAFPQSASDLREFHQGLVVQHGNLQCGSCHVERAGGEPRLHLASGVELSTADTMRLCAQCHGPKFQSYEHGAHGGMTGYWDLSRGDRSRNHCVDCHDPHAPKFAPSRPVLPPRDRFLPAPSKSAEARHG